MAPKPRSGYQNPGRSRRSALRASAERRRRRDAPPGLLAAQLLGLEPPQLAGVRAVEVLEHRRAEPGPHHLGVGVGRARARDVRRPRRSRRAAAGGGRGRRGDSGKRTHRPSSRMRPLRGRHCSGDAATAARAGSPGRSTGAAGGCRGRRARRRRRTTPPCPPDVVGPLVHHDLVPGRARRRAAHSPAGPAPSTATRVTARLR